MARGRGTCEREPRWRVEEVEGTKLPRRMPAIMARRIQRKRRRSRRGRDWRVEGVVVEVVDGDGDCFSGSEGGEVVGGMDEGLGFVLPSGVSSCIVMVLRSMFYLRTYFEREPISWMRVLYKARIGAAEQVMIE